MPVFSRVRKLCVAVVLPGVRERARSGGVDVCIWQNGTQVFLAVLRMLAAGLIQLTEYFRKAIPFFVE